MIAQKYIPFVKKINYDYTALDGKSLADIVEVLYTWQQLKSDEENKFLIKRYSLTQITLDNSIKQFTVNINSSDFNKVEDKQIYFEVFSIKYSGESFFRDIVLKNPDNDTYSTIEIRSAWTQITN